jgi:flagellar protein FlaG
MSLLISPAASTAVAAQAQPAAPPAQPAAQTAAAAAVPAVTPVEKAPAVKVEPLVDPDEMRANLEAAIEKLNEQVARNGRGLNFAIDEKLNRPIITVRSTATGEVVRTIPNEVVIKVAHNIEDIKGLLMDHKL